MGFLYPDEVMKVFKTVNLKKKEGMRDYTILHLLYDSGARATEIATLNFDYFDPRNETIAVLGKGNRYRLINLWPKTAYIVLQGRLRRPQGADATFGVATRLKCHGPRNDDHQQPPSSSR